MGTTQKRAAKYSNGQVLALALAILFACCSVAVAIVAVGTSGFGIDRSTLNYTWAPEAPQAERCHVVQVNTGMTLSGVMLSLRQQEPDVLNSSVEAAINGYATAWGHDASDALPGPGKLSICVSPDGKRITGISPAAE